MTCKSRCRPLVLALVLACLLMAIGCATTPPMEIRLRQALAELYWAADTGNPEAQLRLGQIYGRGSYGVTRDYAMALQWLRRAADAGNARARERLTAWTRGERAEALVVAAQSALANGHTGYGVRLLRALAEADVHQAAYRLGRLYLADTPPGPDTARARYWLARAAAADDANARYLLGTLQARGVGGMPDAAAAAQQWRRCAARSHARCQYSLGLLYVEGKGVPRDLIRGTALIRAAAAQDYGRAQAWLERWDQHCRSGSAPVRRAAPERCRPDS